MTCRSGLLGILLAGAGFLLPASLPAASQENVPESLVAPPASTPQIAQWLAESRRLEGSDFQQSLDKAQQALAAARQQALPVAELASLLQKGRAQRLLSDYPGTLRTVQEGMLLAESLKEEATRGELFLLRGTVEWNLARIPEATVSMMEARRLGEALDDKSLQLGAYLGQGLVRARSDDFDSAVPLLETALQLAEETGDERLGAVLNSAGSVSLQRKDYPRARAYFERALPIVRGANNQRLTAYVLLNLGQVFTETGDQGQAGQFLNEAMAICQRFQLRRGIADIEFLLAGRARRLGQFDESRAHLQAALAIAQELGNPDLFVSIYQEYIQTEEARGDYQSALRYTKELARQLDAVRGEKSRREAAELQARYEAESRSRQIKLLQRDRDIQQADLALKAVELGRTRAHYFIFAIVLALGAASVAAFANRQRTVARLTRRRLAETQAAKEEVEVEDARKSQLLTIAARELRDSEARFRSAFESSALGIALVAPNGRWLRVNPALCRIIGYTEAELLAIDFQTITYPPDLNADLALHRELMAGKIASYNLEKRYIHKDGHLVWIRLDVAMVTDPESQKPQYMVSQVQDIEERRRAQAQLHAAKEEAEKASAAKNEFLSRMSHELRTPLNAVIGFGQLLELQDFGERHNQSVTHILAAGRHLLELINEVLDITQIESGNFSVVCEPTSVPECVRGVVELVQPLVEQAGVEIVDECGDPGVMARVLADPRRLRQVLLNLMSNAIKYNRRGGEITVRCRMAGDRCRIEICDTGVGIGPDDLERIFSPFTRLPATEEVPGTGLGLSLSKGLTETMGGSLAVSSVLGRGSTFSLELPCAAALAHRLEPQCAEAVQPGLYDR